MVKFMPILNEAIIFVELPRWKAADVQ